jgi:stage V sporulation protein R
MSNITPELAKEQERIEGIARSHGLDFFKTVFEMVSYEDMNSLAAYGGFPTRYPHWRYGMEYERISKSYAYGLSKIYEMVINNDPCYAYLLEANEMVDQKLVMAHVYGHCDFFKNNQWYSKTDRKMMDTMANHAVRIRRYQDEFGLEKVEDFIDKAHVLQNTTPENPVAAQREYLASEDYLKSARDFVLRQEYEKEIESGCPGALLYEKVLCKFGK